MAKLDWFRGLTSLETGTPGRYTPIHGLDLHPRFEFASGCEAAGAGSTGPLSDLRYRQVRLDLGFIVRMRARQAPLPPITADCHRLLPAIIVA